MEHEDRIGQFEKRRKKLWQGLAEQTGRIDQLLKEMIAEASDLGCFPRERFVRYGQLGSRKAEVAAAEALYLGAVHGRGHALLIPAEDRTFAVVTTDRKAINRIEKLDSYNQGGFRATKTHLEYHQYSTWFRPIEPPLFGLELRLRAAKRLGEIMQTAVELKSRREKEQGV